MKRATLLERILAAEPHYVFLLGLLPGFLLVFASIPGIGFLTAHAPEFAPVDREVGYLAALNWSLAYAVFFPGALYLMTESLQGIADALDQLHMRGMVRDRAMEIVRENTITEAWIRGAPARRLLLFVFAALIPGIYAVAEWLPNNLLRLLHSGPRAAWKDYDWGLAGVMHAAGEPQWSLLYRLGNAAFDLIAFLTEGLLIASCFAYFLLLLDLGRVLPGGARNSALYLVPDLRSSDKRRGFEVFADPLQQSLGVALLTYLILYCVRLEGVYMESRDSTSLAAFVQADIWSGAIQAAGFDKSKVGSVLASVVKHLFSTGDATVRGILAWLMAVLTFTCSLIVVVMTVQKAASRARSNVSRSRGKSLFGGAVAAEAGLAARMVVWPLGYLKLSRIIALMLLATCTLYFYRIGLFIAGFVAVVLLIRLINGIIRPGREDEERDTGEPISPGSVSPT